NFNCKNSHFCKRQGKQSQMKRNFTFLFLCAFIKQRKNILAKQSFVEKTWHKGRVTFSTPSKKPLTLIYDDNSKLLRLYFLQIDKPINSISQLMHLWNDQESAKKDETEKYKCCVYLEWCDEKTGKYQYFDLFQCFQQLNRSYLLLYDFNKELKPTFEESKLMCMLKFFNNSFFYKLISRCIETMLRDNDVLIRSFQLDKLSMTSKKEDKTKSKRNKWQSGNWRFTLMGVYEGHELYLGGAPEQKFIKECNISFVFSCRFSKNTTHNVKHCLDTRNGGRGECHFDVSTWKEEFDIVIDCKRKIALLEELDTHIDKIHSELKCGNVYIHCLAGAHRSPFITGCYLAKYAGMKGKGSKYIYDHMHQLRNIVQPLTYPRCLDQYIQHIESK
ncbi:hypothetical protein RFI_06879, partial [Reticulomyxa filosa]